MWRNIGPAAHDAQKSKTKMRTKLAIPRISIKEGGIIFSAVLFHSFIGGALNHKQIKTSHRHKHHRPYSALSPLTVSLQCLCAWKHENCVSADDLRNSGGPKDDHCTRKWRSICFEAADTKENPSEGRVMFRDSCCNIGRITLLPSFRQTPVCFYCNVDSISHSVYSALLSCLSVSFFLSSWQCVL